MVRSQALLGIPPHRVACALGVHDHRRMRTASDRGAIGVVEEIAGQEIACMPAVDDQGGGPGPEVGNALMERVEVLRDGGILEGVFRDVFELEQSVA